MVGNHVTQKVAKGEVWKGSAVLIKNQCVSFLSGARWHTVSSYYQPSQPPLSSGLLSLSYISRNTLYMAYYDHILHSLIQIRLTGTAQMHLLAEQNVPNLNPPVTLDTSICYRVYQVLRHVLNVYCVPLNSKHTSSYLHCLAKPLTFDPNQTL